MIDAEAAGRSLDPPHDATCDDLGFGYVAPDVLDGARRALVAGDRPSHISGVPRLGAKLVLVEARDAKGRRVGAGCAALGTIDDDTPVAVALELVPRVQELGRNLAWRAVAVHSRLSDDADELLVVSVVGAQLDVRSYPAPGVRAPAIWGQKVWALQPDGWYQFTIAGMPAAPAAARRSPRWPTRSATIASSTWCARWGPATSSRGP